MANVGELDRIRRFLRDNPGLHDQGLIACGTVGCIAGWTKALDRGAQANEVIDGYVWGDGAGFADEHDPIVVAQRILGLEPEERDAVFFDTMCQPAPEEEALLLIDALIARDKGEAGPDDLALLERYDLPTEPGGDQP